MANDQVKLTGLQEIQSSDTTLTDDLTVTDALDVQGNAKLGNSVSDGIALYGTTTISQRAGTAQSSSLIVSTSIGTAAKAFLDEVWATLTALGVWKGAS